jgi:hypothetical protein
MIMRRSVAAILVLAACSSEPPAPVLAPPEPGLASEPRWLTFTCVEPGCDTALEVTVKVVGDRDLAVKRVTLSDRERDDFVVTPSKEPPFVLKKTESFKVNVQFKPTGDPRLGDVDVLVTYTDASANEAEMRVAPGELEVPLVRRLIGEPIMAVSPDALVFGAVRTGERKTLPVTVRNEGFGNVGLVIGSARSDIAEVTVGGFPQDAILPMESHDLEVTFAPVDETYVEGFLTVRSADENAPSAMIAIAGTSIPRALIAVTPEDGVDLGEIPVRSSAQARMVITNRGAEGLSVSEIALTAPSPFANIELELPRNATTATVAPLGSIEVGVVLTASSTPGELDTRVRIVSSDRMTPVIEVPIVGLVTEPNIDLAPLMLDFGRVPRGWSVPKPIAIENTGYGDLVITNVTMVFGSSQLFTLRTIPNLPVRLRHGQRLGLEVEFRSETEASFSGSLSIESNDPDTPFIEIPIAAIGASCLEGCPIANGTPTCTAGSCAIGACNDGFYDTDEDPASGCECREPARDSGSFCAEAQDLGTLPDNNARANASGILPEMDDVDMVRFFAKDDSQFFSDDFDVRVRLESSDPAIRFCVYRHNVANHESACLLENESCPQDRNYRREGSAGPDDSADFTVKIFRAPGSAPTCGGYTLFVSND